GESDYSEIYSFKSGIPSPPVLNSPPHATLNVPLKPDFNWFSSEGAETYRFQLSTTIDFSAIIYDESITDTTFSITTALATNKNHWWRVRAINSIGESYWPTGFGFRTTTETFVEMEEGTPTEFNLSQNYPNPFNPVTEIEFSIADQGFVSLKIYDMLGREAAVLISEDLGVGNYKVTFDASGLSSGTYIYNLYAGGKRFTRKMVFLK